MIFQCYSEKYMLRLECDKRVPSDFLFRPSDINFTKCHLHTTSELCARKP